MISQRTTSPCFSMKCGFISLKCTLVSMAVQVKQNVTSDVITLWNTRALFWTFYLGAHMVSCFSFWYSEQLRALKHSAQYVFLWMLLSAEVQFKERHKKPNGSWNFLCLSIEGIGISLSPAVLGWRCHTVRETGLSSGLLIWTRHRWANRLQRNPFILKFHVQ